MKYTHPSIVKAVIETLEDRRMLSSTSFADGVLNIIGNTDSSNKVSLRVSSDRTTVSVSVNGSFTTVPRSELTDVKIVGGDLSDVIVIDHSLGVKTDIRTGAGNDSIYGGAGNDLIHAGDGNDFVDGRSGGDSINAGAGDDKVYGGDGNDVIDAADGNDTVLAGRGNDKIYGGDGDDHLDGKEGDDFIYGGRGNDRIIADNGADFLDGKEGRDTYIGTSSNDTIVSDAEDGLTDSGTDTPATSGGSTSTPTTDSTNNNTSSGNTNSGSTDSGNTNTGGTGSTETPAPDTTSGSGGNDSTSGGSNSSGGSTENEWDDSDDNTGQAGAPNPVISILGANQMAGQAVHVNGLKSSLGSGAAHEARYEWNFGDSAGKHNVLAGFNAAHVYDKAGTYTITLKITNKSGKIAYETTKVTITADTRRAIYVDAQGNDANSGTSAGNAVRTWDRAKQLAGDNTKILFQRGDTFSAGSTMNLDDSNLVIGAYGEGARPVINWTGGNSGNFITMTSGASNIAIQDLTFSASGSNVATAVRPSGTNITIRGNEFLNTFDAVNLNMQPSATLIQDNVAPKYNGVRSYLVWVAGTDVVIVGNESNSVGESNIRMSQYERVLVANNVLTDADKATVVAQKGSYAYVSNNDVSGNLTTGPLGKSTGMAQDPNYKTVRARWTVFEGNRTDGSGITVVHGAEHVSIRNNLIRYEKGQAITIDGYDSAYDRTATDVQVIGNTAINTATNGNFLRTWAGNSGLVVKNNLYVAPNLVTGSSSSAVMYVLAGNLNGFAEISGNIWPSVTALSYAQGGTHYVWTSWSNSEGYKTASEWESYSQVRGDVYQDVTLKFTAEATVSGVNAGSTLSLAA